ncbi:hypothetical protein D3C81_2294570 [compost metagenome]
MRHHQERHVVMGMHMHNQLKESGLRLGVNADRGFVQNQQIGMIDQRPGQKYALLLAAG